MGAITNHANEIFAITDEDPPNVNPGDTGEAILRPTEKMRNLLKREQLGGVYEKWKSHSLRGNNWGAWVYLDGDEEHDVPKLGTINLGLIWDMRGRTANMAQIGAKLGDAFTAAHSGIATVWKGEAADAAMAKFDEVVGGAKQYEDSNTTLSGATDGLWHNVREALVELAAFGDASGRGGAWANNFGGSDFAKLHEVIDNLSRIVSMGYPTLEHVIAKCFEEGALGLLAGVDGWPEGMDRWPLIRTYLWSLNFIAEEYNTVVTEWRARIKTAVDAIKADFDRFGQVVNSIDSIAKVGEPSATNPFAKVAPPPPQAPPVDKPVDKPVEEPPPPKKDPVDAGGGTGGGGGGTGGGGGGTGGGGGGGGPTPPPPMIVEPLARPEVPATPVPGATEAAGLTDPTDPTSTDPTVPGGPDPLLTPDPTTPPASTVTITEGDREITVSSPDGSGRVSVTIDDGTGPPKHYTLSFADPATSGQVPPGVDGPAGAQPGPAQAGAPQSGAVHSGIAEPAASRPGTVHPGLDQPGVPQAAPVGSGQGAAQFVQAGSDGTARFQDGDLALSAVRQGDGVTLTLEDGSGTPTTYTVDPQGEATGGSASTSAQSALVADDTSWGAAGGALDGLPGQDDRPQQEMGVQPSGTGEAGLSTAGGADSSGQAGSGFGGGMGGAMAGGGAGGGGQGGESERAGSQWRTVGNLFDDDDDDEDVLGGAVGADWRR